ncbi:protein containg methyltransferase domain [Longilinea arvoryzae]|uniref:Protein containg methyltransferase domain n=1 Tax=Longilinea arvoryzae TaxID=360412 RepID=A0A0S7BIS1_9CHLR|nr:class I SAM-dependent methyltransferase [Longilinea arvoryzae]GAP13761.1 protein containg methyltransferase domain [Longilinea arvoryzae]
MFDKNTDRDWKKIGETDPYFGVLTFDQYKNSSLTQESIKDFFRTGESYANEILAIIREKIDPTFAPQNAVDFGCGVGRVLIPLSRHVKTITGIDVSEGMLKEAAKNCKKYNIDNCELVHSDGSSIGVTKKFDFIHSFIVFQHIPVNRGINLFSELVDHLEMDGVGVIHFTYYRKASSFKNFLYRLIKRSNILSGIWNIYKGNAASSPILQMNMYDVNQILYILQNHDCHNIHIRLTNHGDIYFGIIVFFQKKHEIINGVS